MMLTRVFVRAFPKQIYRSQGTRLAYTNNVAPTSLVRSYATKNESEPEAPKQTEEKKAEEKVEQENTEQQGEQKKEEKPRSNFGPIVVYSVLLGGGYLLYNAGFAKPVVDWVNESVLGSVKSFGNTLKTNLYHLIGISTEEVPFLPPALPDGYGRKYTIVIDMDALANMTQASGVWRIQKRAGLDYFLNTIVRNYEIVLYTKEYQGMNQSAIFKLDPTGVLFQHTKFRDSGVKNPSMQFTDRVDLFRRDPARIIFIDSTAPDKSYNHSNVICVGPPASRNDVQDTVLIDLTRILNSFAIHNGNDIRPLVNELQGPDVEKKIKELIDRSSRNAPPPPAGGAQQQAAGSKGWGLFGR